MMRASVYQDGHAKNSMFCAEDPVHKYNPTFTPRLLRKEFAAAGIEINTADLQEGERIAFELHIEGRPLAARSVPRYLIATENPYINKLNADPDYLKQFREVFTWDKRFFHLPNVTPIMVPNELAWESFPRFDQRDIFACLINANKGFPRELNIDLYQERVRVIRWYERNASGLFSLYGRGWNKPPNGIDLTGKLARRIGRLRTQLYGYKPFPSYRGEVKDKREVMSRTKFSYCYENVRDLSNYITEKIFDAFLSGSVPIYWGADNVTAHIPANCFIDRRNFTDMDTLHNYLVSIDQEQYLHYQEAIETFLTSQEAQKFRAETFVRTIINRIISLEKQTSR
jgi:alpha(1,3/1,4) fucosyltransferase